MQRLSARTTLVARLPRKSILCLLLTASLVAAADEAAPFDAYFSRLDSYLTQLAATPEVQTGEPAAVEKQLQAALGANAAMTTLLRASAKGKITTEVVQSGAPEKARSVAKQPWFVSAGAKMQPYYGSVQPDKGSLQLLWARPVTTQAKAGAAKPAGALAARIDLAQALAALAPGVSAPFSVMVQGRLVYAHAWKEGDSGQAVSLAVKGVEGLMLRIQPPPPPPVAAPASPSVVTEQAPPQGTMPGGKLAVLLAALAGVVVLLLAALVVLIGRSQRKRTEHAARERERREALAAQPRKPPTSIMTPPLPQPHTGAHATVPARSPESHAAHAAPPSVVTPSSGMTRMPSAPHVGTGSSGALPSAETIAQLRQQLQEEIRGQLMQEMEAERKKFAARAEVFTRTVATHVQELVERIGEAETRWVDLSASMKSSAFKLKQALDGFEHRGP
jgi:hypothetical protein